MIYTVECRCNNREAEPEWNDFYSLKKLPALISVTGFLTSQRFIADQGSEALYLALHSIKTPAVLESEEYRLKGGGHFAKWQSYITHWHRNIYGGINVAPAVSGNEYLLMGTEDQPLVIELGLNVTYLNAEGLDRAPQRRWMTTITESQFPKLPHPLPAHICVYRPMTEQLTPPQMTQLASAGERDA
ncbi:sugar ABC transporter [Celerinatantimonas sp. YJH-8]|uniref:sugar ABC transporter n=1 Tax=Celerinatantimonas sp. YJH-8 TaxID=3228714 RepID=UPI0038BE6045